MRSSADRFSWFLFALPIALAIAVAFVSLRHGETRYLELGALVTASLTGSLAILAYRRDVRHKQTDWLYQLFTKFYEQPTYQAIRKVLDYKIEPEYSELQRQIAEPGVKDLEEKFSDYLNFFEFICNLQQTGRMDRRDINNMFDYYLTSLSRMDWATAYVNRNGFEALSAEFKRRRGQARAS